jgi:large subunit ribosomal protein L18
MGSKSKSRVRESKRVRRHGRVRRKVEGSTARPRLVIHRSLKNIQGHIADDESGRVLLGISTLAPELREIAKGEEGGTKTKLSKAAGKMLAERAKAAGITSVVFDRAGYRYHGRVAAFAEGAREGGLEF